MVDGLTATPVRLVVRGSRDVQQALRSPAAFLSSLATAARFSAGQLEVLWEPAATVASLRQQADSPAGVLLFSIEPELGLHAADAPADLPPVAQFKADLLHLVQRWRAQGTEHILVLNASSIVPAEQPYHYQNSRESIAERIQRLNLALLEVSATEGISIVDVDRAIAEMGGADHVQAALHYSPAANHAICQEVLRILLELLPFQQSSALLRLSMPYVGRGVEHGRLLCWHKTAGSPVASGDDLADVEVKVRKMARTKSSLHLSSGQSNKTGGRWEKTVLRLTATEPAVLQQLFARPGQDVTIGSLLAALTTVPDTAGPLDEEAIKGAAEFRVVANPLPR